MKRHGSDGGCWCCHSCPFAQRPHCRCLNCGCGGSNTHLWAAAFEWERVSHPHCQRSQSHHHHCFAASADEFGSGDAGESAVIVVGIGVCSVRGHQFYLKFFKS